MMDNMTNNYTPEIKTQETELAIISKQTNKQTAQLRLLNQLSTRLQSLLGSDSFFQEVVNIIQGHFNYYCIHIWSVNNDVNEGLSVRLEAQAGPGYREHIRIGHKVLISLKGSKGITKEVLYSKKSYLCNDVSKDPNFSNLSMPVKTQSQISLPIMKDRAVVAILTIESDIKNDFEENDVITLEAVASQISVAISNQRLYSEAKDFNKLLQEKVEQKTLELRQAHKHILEQQKLLQKENKALKNLVNQDQKKVEFIGESIPVKNTLSMVEKIAPTMATVLIQGESGTGKELISRQLHIKSTRADKPFVVVNCGTLQESLLESELFGHEKGSFTGAHTQKIGLCEMADGGTLFLDEIGEMPINIQAKILRFLQGGEFYRIGGKRPIHVDVRMLSATNRDLEQEVKKGNFREALFYKINTIPPHVPPLRKRKEDIPALITHFLKNSRFGGQNIHNIDANVIEVFKNYDWPGNVRELQNTVERLKILAESDHIQLEDIPFNIRLPESKVDTGDFTVGMSIEDVEKKHILRTLSYHRGNKTKTANSLAITIKTLYNKLHRYHLMPDEELTSNQAG